MSKRIQDVVNHYLAWLKQVKSSNTVLCYRSDLKRFTAFLATQEGAVEVQDITKAHIEDFLGSLPGASQATKARCLSVVRSFFGYLVEQGALGSDPSQEVNHIRRIPGPLRPPSQGEVRKVVEVYEVGSRDRAILEMLAAGIKCDAVRRLKLGDIHLTSESVMVEGYEVTLPAEAVAALDAYLNRPFWTYWKTTNGERDLFLNNRRKRLSRQKVWALVKEAAAQVGVSMNPEAMRRGRAMFLIEAGVAHKVIQKQLGYADYTSVNTLKRRLMKEVA